MNKPFSSRFKRGRLTLPAALGLGLVLLPATTSSQSLWRDDVSRPMYADKRASGVGDIVTIVVQENTTTSKNNKTATSKQSAMDASVSSFFYSPTASGLLTKSGQLPALKYSSKNDFSGGGTIDQFAEDHHLRRRPGHRRVAQSKPRHRRQARNRLRRGAADHPAARSRAPRRHRRQQHRLQLQHRRCQHSHRFPRTLTDSQRKGWLNKFWDKISPF